MRAQINRIYFVLNGRTRAQVHCCPCSPKQRNTRQINTLVFEQNETL